MLGWYIIVFLQTGCQFLLYLAIVPHIPRTISWKDKNETAARR